MRKILLCLFIVAGLTSLFAMVSVNNVSCQFNPDIMTGAYCKIVKTRGAMKYINAGAFAQRPIDVVLIYLTLIRKAKKIDVPVAGPFKYNMCHVKQDKGGNYFFRRMVSLTANSVGLKCPLKGNISIQRMPSFLHFAQGLYPAGNYVLFTNIYARSEHLGHFNLSFAIVSKDSL